MITPELVGEFVPDNYSLKHVGLMGSLDELKVGELSLIGEADELTRGLPITIIHLKRTIFGRQFGRQWYLAVQIGGRVLSMYEGDEDGINYVIQFDSSVARRRARRMTRS